MNRELVLKIAQMLDTIMGKFLIQQKEIQTIVYNVINLVKHVMVKLLKIVYLVKILITFSKNNVWLALNSAQTVIRKCNVQVVPKNILIFMRTNASSYNQLTRFVIKVKFAKIVTRTVKLVKEQLKKIVQVVIHHLNYNKMNAFVLITHNFTIIKQINVNLKMYPYFPNLLNKLFKVLLEILTQLKQEFRSLLQQHKAQLIQALLFYLRCSQFKKYFTCNQLTQAILIFCIIS
ncbi:hypothetical protein TTHERM_001202195 (macronuclear) [Tetrahymena thermophila SB210]|uniref:Uncharacterized protein n=1 Tax=Tetrahymena thermophila (strain SB210) TaxID=312017 RepID=W7XK31_TETTS|nr:hypothetical protein TTHERM_001202195 [Tetrahymena thermophila SB210]EWS76171.1 hypothetical protein TTHERM_001202195 [Tetrahymena thermophila SB210]|eukprot:XP_012651295.1 hypothetical protein TTHERM_001202195 [Tetrahymena thermophila SB210]